MNSLDKLKQLEAGLNGATGTDGLIYSAQITSLEDEDARDVLIVNVQDREEFPIFIAVDSSQIMCITYLWTESQVKVGKREEMLDALLSFNIPMPLSSFSKIGDQYVIFGSVSIKSSINEVIEEIDVLSENTLTAVEEMKSFLNA